MTSEPETISIDIVSDVMCPWCYIGQKRLDKAMASLPEINVQVHWRPFQLDPTLPSEGKDRETYLAEKFGSAERARELYGNIRAAGDMEGIRFDFNAIKVSPNTLDAHRLIRWAGSAGAGVQDSVARRLFQLYFEEGANVADQEVLAGAAADCGMDPEMVRGLLAGDADRDAVVEEISRANRMGVTGVPCFIIENRYAVMGAQDPATLASAVSQVAEAKRKGELPAPPAVN